MTDAPERIWATEDAANLGEDKFHTTRPMPGLTEYIRADLMTELVKAVSLTVKSGNLRDAYHALPNDKNRIGDKKSRKSKARDAWLKVFKKAETASRAALAKIKEQQA